MKNLYLIALLISFLNFEVRANNCVGQVESLLTEASEILVFKKHTFTHIFADCNEAKFGADIVLHEAVHFEDLGVPAGLNEQELMVWYSDPSNINFNLLLIDGSRLGEMQSQNLPMPRDLILNFLKKNYPSIYSDPNHSIQSLVDGYLKDHSTLASFSFVRGLTTELNAYIHGLRAEQRIKRSLGIGGSIYQRYGVLGFMFFFKAYLSELRTSYPAHWNSIVNSSDKSYIKEIFAEALIVLKFSDHCNTMDWFERNEFFALFEDQNYFLAVENIVGKNSSLLKEILCK